MIEGEIPRAEKIIAKNMPVAVMEDIVVKMIKKMYVREQFKKGVEKEKGNEHMQIFYKDEMFNKVTDSRQYKKKKRIADAKAEAADPENLIDIKIDEFSELLKEGELDKMDYHWIPSKAEDFFVIPHWKDLNDLYLTSSTFSDSVTFKIVFNVMILWIEIAKKIKKPRQQDKGD